MRLYLSKMLKNVFFLVFFFVVDDRDDTTSTDNRHYDKSNKVRKHHRSSCVSIQPTAGKPLKKEKHFFPCEIKQLHSFLFLRM